MPSTALLLNLAWPLHRGYMIDNRVVCELGEVGQFISPGVDVARLLDGLLKIHRRVLTPLAFCQEHGLLGQRFDSHPSWRAEATEQAGDQVDWINFQAAEVFDAVGLLDAASNRKDAGAAETARESLVTVINPHIEGIPHKLRSVPGGLRSMPVPRAPIDIIWETLAAAAEGQIVVRRCGGCGSLLIASDPRTMFHPRCGKAVRMRNYRQRNRTEK
jgi:hypothetical protein